MSEKEVERKVPRDWREYFSGMRETVRVCKWILQELSTVQGYRWVRRMGIALVIAIVFQVAQPAFIAFIFDGLVESNKNFVLFGFGGFIFCVIAQNTTHHIQMNAREWLIGINWRTLDNRITELFFEKSMGQHLQEGTSLHASNIDKGRWKVVDTEIMLLFEGAPVLLSLALSYIFLWFLSPVAGFIITSVIIAHLCWSFFLNQRVMQVCVPIDKNFRALNRHRFERWESVERVKTSAKEEDELVFMDSWFESAITEDRNFWLWFIKHCTAREAINTLGLVTIMVYGAWLVWSGAWTIGLLYPLYSWSSGVSERIWRVGHIEHQLSWNMPPVKSMIDAITIEPDVVNAPDAIAVNGEGPIGVAIRNVSHTYSLGDIESGDRGDGLSMPVLSDVSFVIEPGRKVALLGPSGAGKTTIMRLLLRAMDPQQGVVSVNGHNLRQLDHASWMRSVGYIPQHPQVFDGTIRDNLVYGLSKKEQGVITDDELWALMRLLRVDFGERLVDGLDTIVGRAGVKLSGGEAQRLMIGAAAAKKPRFMVIDEATSSLDSTTELGVQAGLSAVLSGDVGALVVAHRLSTVRKLCDQFVVLRPTASLQNGDSQVEAVAGSFEELYTTSPTFRRLADDQGVVI